MAKKPHKKSKKVIDEQTTWITMKSGILAVTLVSIGLGLWTAWNVMPTEGFVNAVLWGIGFGGSVWLVFLGALYLNRFFRRK